MTDTDKITIDKKTIKQRFESLIEDLKQLIPNFEGSDAHKKVLDVHEAVQQHAGEVDGSTSSSPVNAGDTSSVVVPDNAAGANVAPSNDVKPAPSAPADVE